MHDFKQHTAEAMPELIRQLKAGGYKVVSVFGVLEKINETKISLTQMPLTFTDICRLRSPRAACFGLKGSIDVSRPHAPGPCQGRPDAGNEEVHINSSSLDRHLVILADQALEIVAIAKIAIATRIARSA
jgi:hypothetical protein